MLRNTEHFTQCLVPTEQMFIITICLLYKCIAKVVIKTY